MKVFELESNNMSFITKDFETLIDRLLEEEENIAIEGSEFTVRAMEMTQEAYDELQEFEGF